MIHVNWRFFCLRYDTPSDSLTWSVEALINILTRFSVPCFVMISGAFLLNSKKNENAVEFYKKTSYKIFLPAVIATILLIAFRLAVNILTGENPWDGMSGIPKGNFYNMWYIWMLAGLYLLTPGILSVKNKLTHKQYVLCSLIMLVWAVISQATSQQSLSYSIGVVIAFVSYFLLGDIIKEA